MVKSSGFQNTFNEGMDKDSSVNKYGNSVYYDGRNVRLVSRDSLSSGSLTNVIGNKEAIDVASCQYNIISSCDIDDKLILFYAINKTSTINKTASVSDGSELSIAIKGITYKFVFSNTTSSDEQYIGTIPLAASNEAITTLLSGNSLIASLCNVYYNNSLCNIAVIDDVNSLLVSSNAGANVSIANNPAEATIGYVEDYDDVDSVKTIIPIFSDDSTDSKLNFSNSEHLSTLGRYETNNVSRIYWANGIDPLRSLKLGESYAFEEPTIFDHIPNQSTHLGSALSSGIELEEKSGGSLQAGVYQYAIQTISKTGSVSSFSHLSRLISIDNNSLSTPVGSNVEDICNKSVLVSTGILGGERYRLVSLYYSSNDASPIINIVSEGYSYDTLTIVDSGNYIGSLTLEEFRTISTSTLIPSVIESKDNLLFAGNLKEDEFFDQEIEDWDSRAYAFNGYNGTARIYTHPESLGINDYYSWMNVDGVGKNVAGGIEGDFTDWQHNNSNSFNRSNELFFNNLEAATYAYHPDYSSTAPISGYVRSSGSTGLFYGLKGKNVSILYKTATNSLTHSSAKIPVDKDASYSVSGYDDVKLIECQPDEIYRIGVVFFNEKGQSSFVKWIADVRIPSVMQEVSWSDAGSDFDTDIKSGVIEVSISGAPNYDWQLVRAKRTSEDRSIVSRGIIQPLITKDSSSDILRPYCDEDNSVISIAEMNGTLVDTDSTVEKNFVEFISPESKFNNPFDIDYTGNKLILSHVFRYGNINSKESFDNKVINLYSGEVKNIKNESTLTSVTYDYNIEDSVYVSTESYASDIEPRSYNINGESYVNQTYLDVGSTLLPKGVRSSRCSGLILALDSDLAITDSESNRMLMGYSLTDSDISKYGGYSSEARGRTEYIKFSDVMSSSDTSALGTEGDTYQSQMSNIRLLFNSYSSFNSSQQQLFRFFMSSQINCDRRIDKIDDNLTNISIPTEFISESFIQETVAEGIKLYPESYNESIGDLYIYNPAYSTQGSAAVFYPKPENFITESKNPVKVISSQLKINGEEEDSWLRFLVSDYIEVDGDYGELKSMVNFKSRLYFLQEDAIGVLSVNERSLINDASGQSLSLGTGGVLARFDYLSYNSGIANGRDLIRTKNSIYFIDENAKELYSISSPDNAISSLKGMSSFFFENVNKGEHRSLGYDVKYDEVLINTNGITVCYNELLKTFTSIYTIDPVIFINTPKRLFSQYYDCSENFSNYIYAHNEGNRGEWYPGVYYTDKSTVTVIINPNGNSINAFDNVNLRTNVFSSNENAPNEHELIYETVDRLVFGNSYIDDISIESATSSTNINTPKIKRIARAWKAQVPLTMDGNRFVDSYLMLTLEFDNNQNKLFKLHDVRTYFRESNY